MCLSLSFALWHKVPQIRWHLKRYLKEVRGRPLEKGAILRGRTSYTVGTWKPYRKLGHPMFRGKPRQIKLPASQKCNFEQNMHCLSKCLQRGSSNPPIGGKSLPAPTEGYMWYFVWRQLTPVIFCPSAPRWSDVKWQDQLKEAGPYILKQTRGHHLPNSFHFSLC